VVQDGGVPAAAATRSSSHQWWTLAAVCGATFMLLVDVTIVQVALPRIQQDLHAGFTSLQWALDAYALTLSALILAAGGLADRLGRKNVFLGGVTLFTGASILCGLATSALFLDLSRALQGVGGAVLFATSLALIGQEFHGRDRMTAIGAWSATVGGAVALGPLLGGAITEGLGWEWIFFVNGPIGVAVVAICSRQTRNVKDPDAKRLDLAGVVTFTGALFLLVFGLLRGNENGWSSVTILGSLIGSGVLFGAFVWVERRLERPMFDLTLFRNHTFTGVSLGTFAIGAGMFAMFPYMSLYFQNVLGYSPLEGGVLLLPTTLPVFLVPIVMRRFPQQSPRLLLWLGLVVTGLGLLVLVATGVHANWAVLLTGLLLAGLGIGIANPAIAQIALGVVDPARSGMASGISNTFRIGGLATGIAGLGAIFGQRVESEFHGRVPQLPAGLARGIAATGTHAAAGIRPGSLRDQAVVAARAAFVTGMHDILVVGALVVLAGAVCVFMLVHMRDLHGHAAPAAAAPDGS
jgi:EmrB/QacA subfamily drug resistance transporter